MLLRGRKAIPSAASLWRTSSPSSLASFSVQEAGSFTASSILRNFKRIKKKRDYSKESRATTYQGESKKGYDVVVVGGGVGGMTTAARLQAEGLSTAVVEQHTAIGGCAGHYTRKGFNFDVGATTLVDFEAGGVGGID